MQNRTAVILCGGKGTRLGILGKKIPKALVKLQRKPILWFILKSLKKNKFNHYILPIGYKGKKIEKYIKGNSEFKKFNIDLINTGLNTSIAKRIYKIKKHINSNDFLLVNGDAVFDANLNQIYNYHSKKKSDMSFICCEAEADFGTVGTRNGKIINFERSLYFNSVNTKNKNFKGNVYSGMAIINKKILKEKFINKENFEKEFYPKIIKKYNCKMYSLKGFWYAMDNMKDVDKLNKKKVDNKTYKKISGLAKKLNDK